MKIVSLISVLTFCLASAVPNAQTHIIKEAIQQISQYKNISYIQDLKANNPFTDEIISLNIKSFVSKNEIQGKNVELFSMEEARGFNYISNGSVRLDLELKNKTYTFKDNVLEEPYFSPYGWMKFMQSKLAATSEKIQELPDTIVNNTACYHLKFIAVNSFMYDLYLNNKTYLPVYTRRFLQGTFGKEEVNNKNLMTMIEENNYSGYDLNSNNFPEIGDITIPSGFNPEKEIALLSPGVKVPDWELKDLKGNNFSNIQSQGKITLIDFSFNGCGACMASLPTLKRLHEKYKGSDVKIVSINTFDSKESIIRFVRKYNINYPVLLQGQKVGKIFQVSAYPTFYLVDKKGKVVNAIRGYSDELEQNIIAQIEKIK